MINIFVIMYSIINDIFNLIMMKYIYIYIITLLFCACLIYSSDHTDEILDASFSLSGKYIITASADKTAILYNATTYDVITVFKEHENEITKVFFLYYNISLFYI